MHVRAFMVTMFPSILFIALVFFLVIFLSVYLKRITKNFIFCLSAILVWLFFAGTLSLKGFFMNFSGLPPRIFIIILPMVFLLLYASFSKTVPHYLRLISLTELTLVQSFRIPMEIILWLLASQQIIADLMTWHGRNFDIIIGISAPFIAYFCYVSKQWPEKIALIWNGLGILLLLNVFLNGLLSAPTPFHVFITTPPNTFVGMFPFTWLPSFVLPCAFLFHILSIRKILNAKQTNQI